jgi:hypothetical protein
MLDTVTEEQWREFDAHGVVSLGVALSPAELGAISERLDAIMLGEVGDPYPFDRMLMQLEGAGGQTRGYKGRTLDYRKIQGLEHDPFILNYLKSDLFRCVAERTYSGSVGIYRTMFFNKTALSDAPTGGGSQLGWHQDRWSTLDRCAFPLHMLSGSILILILILILMGVDESLKANCIWLAATRRDPRITVYLAIDPATEDNGCMHIIPRAFLCARGCPASRT